MLSRRNLRVKVMQVLYSIDHSNTLTIPEARKVLRKSIDRAYCLLYFSCSLAVRIADMISKEAAIKTSKYLPTEDDLRFSTKLTLNPLVQAFRQNKKIADQLKSEMSEDEASLVKALMRELLEREEYKEYCRAQNSDLSAEQEIFRLMFDKIIFRNNHFHQFVEDNYPESISELSKINIAISEAIGYFSEQNDETHFQFAESADETEFAMQLLQKTIEHNARFTELIQPKLKNWDIDRIAHLDMILMKMALCELLYFDQIPVKVSINEYIDVSKIYSTAKSKDFINGILDSIMHELRSQNAIKKTGRGLVE